MNNKEKFDRYAALLTQWSAKMNLVAPSTLADIETRHFADSAQLADILPHDVNIIDMGSGAGFPGVVLAILGWRVTCIESIGKKTTFLNTVKTELGLENLTIFHGRVEDFIRHNPPRPQTDVFTCRAFAPLIKILDYVVGTKCRLFLLKGRDIQTEITTAQTRYRFDYQLTPSQTGDGFIVQIENIRLFHMK